MKKRPDQQSQPERPEQAKSSTTRIEPKAGTVKAAVLNALRHGEKLTPADVWMRYGTSRLAAIVFDLKESGWSIEAPIVDVTTASGRIAHVARYEMKEAR